MCSSDVGKAELVEVDELRRFVNGPKGRYSSFFLGVFYLGSEGGYDFLAIKKRRQSAIIFKVKEGDLEITTKITLSDDENKWVDITRLFPM